VSAVGRHGKSMPGERSRRICRSFGVRIRRDWRASVPAHRHALCDRPAGRHVPLGVGHAGSGPAQHHLPVALARYGAVMRDGIVWMTGWNEALCVPQAAAATGREPRALDTPIAR
jgi:hypothetical protein